MKNQPAKRNRRAGGASVVVSLDLGSLQSFNMKGDAHGLSQRLEKVEAIVQIVSD